MISFPSRQLKGHKMQHQSIIEPRGQVAFPEFLGERHYMVPFTQADGLPAHLSHWQPTVNAMLLGVTTPETIFLMVDQSFVTAGQPQRRPGLHIDGYWNAGTGKHQEHTCNPMIVGSHRGGGSDGDMPRHRGNPEPFDFPPMKDAPGKPAGWEGGWSGATYDAPEAIILASNVQAAHGFVGTFFGDAKDGGDCAHLSTDGMTRLPFGANRVYAGNVCSLHESLPVQQDCQRTLVRLNVPGWTPQGLLQ